MECFFSSLKTEQGDRRQHTTRDKARADVFDYIARFYNPRRRHSLRDYLSPVQFEEITAALELSKPSGESVAAHWVVVTQLRRSIGTRD